MLIVAAKKEEAGRKPERKRDKVKDGI